MLADDHTLVRAGIRSLLEGLDHIEVVAETGDGREALRLAKVCEPDVVLMDIGMPVMNGLEATARITKDFPNVHVIILSMHASEEYVWQALRAGATGYLLKDADAAELEIAVRSAIQGRTYLSPAISKQVVTDYVRRVSGEVDPSQFGSNPFEILTSRQREILQLIAEGNSTKDIAQILRLSVKTIETHRAQLMERLDIHDVAGLVRYAIRTGLIKADG